MHRIVLSRVTGHTRASRAINGAGWGIASSRVLLGERGWVYGVVIVIHHVMERSWIGRERYASKTRSVLLMLISSKPSGSARCLRILDCRSVIVTPSA